MDDATHSQTACNPTSFVMPTGECSSFACPKGYYREASNKSCLPCEASCKECGGPLETDCYACEAGYYLQFDGSSRGKCYS